MLGAVLALAVLSQAHAAPPSFIFILADDMGFGDANFTRSFAFNPPAGGGNYTVNPPRTPNLDALATSENSMIFKHWYAGSAVCSPTR